ncbi:hypothetical protein EV651_101214 [Kribbella sp. VKM Ac-2571]|uniref:hypothetical protein n=1 Tax=Kribbella sp. VKM Ac-2571 TaxID=2512222 RepID=UPI001061933B|nr:hypothetical protein [Kribbella sp. VKM Ac-2571]TDO69175.1 hypothetical protein EV651_101214 [Kribbella sp. VKM Ac-2571]
MLKRTERRPSRASRRTGYVFATVFNAAALYAIHFWPGWQQLSFLTSETQQILGWVTASLIAGLGANVVYLLVDPPQLKALGDLVITGVGLVAIIRVWQVFPFDFGDASFDWALMLRIMLGIGFFGSILAMIVQFVVLVAHGSRARR